MKPHYTNTTNPVDFPPSNRIQVLAEQAFEELNAITTEGVADQHTFDQPWFKVYNQRFAELVIQGCITEIAMIGASNFLNEDVGWCAETAINNIEQRFGLR